MNISRIYTIKKVDLILLLRNTPIQIPSTVFLIYEIRPLCMNKNASVFKYTYIQANYTIKHFHTQYLKVHFKLYIYNEYT